MISYAIIKVMLIVMVIATRGEVFSAGANGSCLRSVRHVVIVIIIVFDIIISVINVDIDIIIIIVNKIIVIINRSLRCFDNRIAIIIRKD